MHDGSVQKKAQQAQLRLNTSEQHRVCRGATATAGRPSATRGCLFVAIISLEEAERKRPPLLHCLPLRIRDTEALQMTILVNQSLVSSSSSSSSSSSPPSVSASPAPSSCAAPLAAPAGLGHQAHSALHRLDQLHDSNLAAAGFNQGSLGC